MVGNGPGGEHVIDMPAEGDQQPKVRTQCLGLHAELRVTHLLLV